MGQEHQAGPDPAAEAMESLYPFLYADKTDLSAVLDQVRASTVAKAAEIIELRRTVAARDGARLEECARDGGGPVRRGRPAVRVRQRRQRHRRAAARHPVPEPGGGARPLPAFGLANDTSVVTALCNDIGVEVVFARQLAAFGGRNDVAVGLSSSATSGWRRFSATSQAGPSLCPGAVPGIEAHSPNRVVTVRAQASLNGDEGIGALVHVIDPVDSLREVPGDLWAANPIDRVEAMLRENRIPIGIVTDGRWWGLVCAREVAMGASGIVDALTWIEEPRTRDAFLTLIGREYLIGGDPNERLPALFEESVAAAEEITEALGAQVRRAVELLIQSFSESAADARQRSLPDPLPPRSHDSYEAAVTVMMRVVFLLFAEERGLLPSGELFDQGYGIAGELERLAARETEESEEALDSTSLTWHRLLATSNALYRGATFENLRMPAYGGSLFDPARFPFLTATTEQGTLGATVSDRVMLHVLRSVQVADIKGEARRISFRDIDVEQIGYMYEGLLGYTAATTSEVVVGIKGTPGEEPEIPLAKLEELAAKHPDRKKFADAIRAWVEGDQPSAKPPSVAAIAKGPMLASIPASSAH